jgi:hypothetical protein
MILHPPLHAAYVFDMRAGLHIKYLKTKTAAALDNLDEMSTYLLDALGGKLYCAVLYSQEYRNLYNANLRVYERIDEIKLRPATGDDCTYIDQNNHQRWQAKVALQQRFFPDSPFTEQKIGYEKGAV